MAIFVDRQMRHRSLIAVFILTTCFSGCTRSIPQHAVVAIYQRSFEEKTPQVRLYLRGARLGELHFEQSSLVHRIGGEANRCDVYGTGFINWQSSTIQVDAGVVRVNGKQLPKLAFESFVIREDGTFVNGYISSAKVNVHVSAVEVALQ